MLKEVEGMLKEEETEAEDVGGGIGGGGDVGGGEKEDGGDVDC